MFVSVKFGLADTRTYTYRADEPFSVGDSVLVDVKGALKEVIVVDVDVPEPPFDCRSILMLVPQKAAKVSDEPEDLL